MSLLIRIDVDRPYGRTPLARHLLSRVSSDLYFPRVKGFGYLTELETILTWLNEASAPAYVFFRRCTLPSEPLLKLLDDGQHEIGMHLENSRSYETFLEEKQMLETHAGRRVRSVSKHGSGGSKYGFHHYAPYEPQRYVEWAARSSMSLFLGNLEDPTLEATRVGSSLSVFPAAFWLEPYWRDTNKFTIDWLLTNAKQRDVVLLVHPENVLADSSLVADFKKLITSLESRILS
jgi:hypothetical protein